MPGTGKTTTLQQDVLSGLEDQGYRFDDIAVGTFTNTMADEFEKRAKEEFMVNGDLTWFDTIHSLCCKVLKRNNVDWDQPIKAAQKKEFCEKIGVPFSKTAEYDKSDTADAEKGNALFDLREFCLNSMKDPIEDWKWAYRQINPEPVLNGRIVKKFNERIESWKKENNYISYIDMIKLCVDNNYVVPCSVLIEDEFQDKSLLELKLFEQWSESAEKTFVAGDPFQAIYGFKGTNPSYMFQAYKQADESVILDNTYRFGSDLWNFANNLLNRANYDVPDISCTGNTEVEFISWRQYMNKVKKHQSDDCFHLARSRHLYDDIENVLKKASVIPKRDFKTKGKVAYENYYQTVLDAVEVAKDVRGSLQGFGDRKIEPDKVDYLLKMCPQSVFSKSKSKVKKAVKAKNKLGSDFVMKDIFSRKEFVNLFLSDNPFNKLNEKRYTNWYKHRDTLAEAYSNGSELSEHVSHDISTIHKAKGKDADYVFLLNGSTKTINKNSSLKSESRVFFVGATRAIEKLYVVDTVEKYKFKMR